LQTLTIKSEKDAFELIQKALKDEIGDAYNIVFEGWPKLTIVLEGEGYAGTITPSLMDALVDFQQGLNRAYAKVVYNQDTARSLKDAEKQEIEFKAKVENNCTKIDIDLTEILKSTVDILGSKMEPKHVVILGVVGMSMWVADSAIKAHYEAEAKIKTVQEETIKATTLSREETKRLEVFAQAIAQKPELAEIQKNAASSHIGLLKGISDAKSIEINGIEFKKEDAKLLSSSKRATSSEVQLNDNYQILSVDTSHREEVKIKVKNFTDGKEFHAKFKDQTLDQSQIRILQSAEWSREKVYLSINATEIRGQVTIATIVGVKEQPN
jgi:hypothetical protein